MPLKFDLATRVKRPSKRPIPLANIKPTQAQAASLFVIYARVLAAWSAGIGRVVDEYERTIAAMTQDSAATTGDAIDGIAAEIQRLVLLLTPDLRRWAVRMEAVQRGKWVQSVLSATDVDLNTILTAGDVEDTLGASVEWSVSLVKDLSDELRKRIANSVFAGFQRRAPAAEIAKEIADATGMARARARRIAGDQTVKLGARLNQARQEQAGISSFKWRHSAKRHPRSWHVHRDGKVFPWEGSGIPADDMPGVPPFCFPSGQPVSFHGDVLVLWRRYHRGELTEIIAGEGVTVSCTPNHPVLTGSGWKAAKDVEIGDYLFEASPQSVLVSDMDVKEAQPLIGDVFGALELVFGSVATNGLGGEFHGDALIDEQINTIDFGDQSLRDHLKASIPQRLGDLFLEVAEVLLRPRLGSSLLGALFESSDATEAGFVCRLDLLSSLLWRHFTPNELPRIAGISDFYALALQEIGDRCAGGLKPFRERFDALARFVGPENFSLIELLAIMCRAIDSLGREPAPTAEMLGQAMPVKANLAGYVAEEHAALQGRYRKVEMVVSRAWQGHVFNLHNRENWYLAGTVPAHNCGCTAQGVISFDEE